jgi:hypothetical protein
VCCGDGCTFCGVAFGGGFQYFCAIVSGVGVGIIDGIDGAVFDGCRGIAGGAVV